MLEAATTMPTMHKQRFEVHSIILCAKSNGILILPLAISERTHINGVKRRPTNFGDPFHWANLAVMHASKAFAGDTENGAHEQVHHRQCMMTMHSVHSDDAPIHSLLWIV